MPIYGYIEVYSHLCFLHGSLHQLPGWNNSLNHITKVFVGRHPSRYKFAQLEQLYLRPGSFQIMTYRPHPPIDIMSKYSTGDEKFGDPFL